MHASLKASIVECSLDTKGPAQVEGQERSGRQGEGGRRSSISAALSPATFAALHLSPGHNRPLEHAERASSMQQRRGNCLLISTAVAAAALASLAPAPAAAQAIPRFGMPPASPALAAQAARQPAVPALPAPAPQPPALAQASPLPEVSAPEAATPAGVAAAVPQPAVPGPSPEGPAPQPVPELSAPLTTAAAAPLPETLPPAVAAPLPEAASPAGAGADACACTSTGLSGGANTTYVGCGQWLLAQGSNRWVCFVQVGAGWKPSTRQCCKAGSALRIVPSLPELGTAAARCLAHCGGTRWCSLWCPLTRACRSLESGPSPSPVLLLQNPALCYQGTALTVDPRFSGLREGLGQVVKDAVLMSTPCATGYARLPSCELSTVTRLFPLPPSHATRQAPLFGTAQPRRQAASRAALAKRCRRLRPCWLQRRSCPPSGMRCGRATCQLCRAAA